MTSYKWNNVYDYDKEFHTKVMDNPSLNWANFNIELFQEHIINPLNVNNLAKAVMSLVMPQNSKQSGGLLAPSGTFLMVSINSVCCADKLFICSVLVSLCFSQNSC